MKASSKLALGIAFVVAFLAEGVPYWRIPHSQASLPSSLYRPGLVVVFVMAAGCRWIARTRFWSTLLVVGASVPCMILARVAYETNADPTSHNLWPFEVVIAAFVGCSAAFVGSLLGGILKPAVPT